jgi:SAM-dependent methyltransferase
MPPDATCRICGHAAAHDPASAFGAVRGNTARFKGRTFPLWKCTRCGSIHSLDPVDFRDIYADYPLNRRRLDVFARGTLRRLLARLERAGLARSHAILDVGCGNGIFVDYLRERGYADATGFDPYVERFAALPAGRRYDCVVANDVVEHVDDPRARVREWTGLVAPGGLLYIGTADAEPVDMADLEPHVMRLHQPFHRVTITEPTLHALARESGLAEVASYRRSYMDTPRPFSNYRFLDEFNRALGHDMDRALDPAAGGIVLRRPVLLFYALFGYLLPVAFEPAVVLRKEA